MEVASFAEIEAEFLERVNKTVWCNVATIDTRNRPRSRILHLVWEGGAGWVATRRQTLKAKHLAQQPYVSLAYIADLVKPTYVDCRAEWDEALETKQHIWNLFLNAPPPIGYDPAPIFESPDHPNFGVLKFTPWRIQLDDGGGARRVWHNNEI